MDAFVKLLDKDEERLSTPSRVTLSGPMTGRQALESIAEQSGNQLPSKISKASTNESTSTSRIHCSGKSLDELLDKLNMSISPRKAKVTNLFLETSSCHNGLPTLDTPVAFASSRSPSRKRNRCMNQS
jgi:cell division septation protein DedD